MDARLAPPLLGTCFRRPKKSASNATTTVHGRDNEVRDGAAFCRVITRLSRVVAVPDRYESNDPAVLDRDHDGPIEFSTATKHRVEIGVGDLLASWHARLETPLDLLEFDEACANCVQVSRSIELTNFQSHPSPHSIFPTETDRRQTASNKATLANRGDQELRWPLRRCDCRLS